MNTESSHFRAGQTIMPLQENIDFLDGRRISETEVAYFSNDSMRWYVIDTSMLGALSINDMECGKYAEFAVKMDSRWTP